MFKQIETLLLYKKTKNIKDRNSFIENNLDILKSMAKKLCNKSISFDDCFQQCVLTFIKVIDKIKTDNYSDEQISSCIYKYTKMRTIDKLKSQYQNPANFISYSDKMKYKDYENLAELTYMLSDDEKNLLIDYYSNYKRRKQEYLKSLIQKYNIKSVHLLYKRISTIKKKIHQKNC